MTGNIFINYRRDESGHVAGRLHESLAPKFGRNKLFMDVDNIPVGRDFEEYLNSQVAACDAMLAIIGPNWVNAKDESGQRRLDNREDFVVIEIGAALTRKIPVVPVLIDGARMPKASELPDSLKSLAKRQAIEVRHANFSRDADALVKRLREALGYDSPGRRQRVYAAKVIAAMAVLFLVGWAGYEIIVNVKTDTFSKVTKNLDAITEKLNADVRAEQERQAKAAVEAAKTNVPFTIRRGIEAKHLGGNITTIPSVSFEECQQQCTASPTCGVFTWFKQNRNCWLYTRAEFRANADFDSGVKN